MSVVTAHERPGVYSVYEASSVVSAVPRSGTAAITAISSGGTAGNLYSLTNYGEAVTAFGSGDALTELVRLLFANGAVRVLAVPVANSNGYAAAFTLLNNQENVRVVVCDSSDLTVQQSLKTSVTAAAQVQRERIAVVCGGASETVSQLVTHAAGLNSERVVLAAPAATGTSGGAKLAAAVAGAICAGSDPAVPLGGAELTGLAGLAASWTETEIDTLIQGGVTPVESVGGICSVVRGVTTRTTTGSEEDATWRELSTILVVDNVIPGIRSALRSRFYRSKNTPQVRSAIRSQVILELENKRVAEIITSYGEVMVSEVEGNPTTCLVTFSFTVANGLNQIWLSAQITV